VPELPASARELIAKIESRTAMSGVIGLGYVGLPLAVELAKIGQTVIGIDISPVKVDLLNKGISYIQDVPTSEVGPLVQSGKLSATTDFKVIRKLDTINICVPTPLRKTKDPDMSFIDAACREIALHMKPGTLVVLESTTYPGTTDEFVLPMLEQHGLKAGRDFFLCFSPERVDPGNPVYQTKNIPKVVGGITPACTAVAERFYSLALDRVVTVGSTKAAEMVKLLENTFRMINIGLANEMALMCDRMGINVWEVIDAAATKPFGFMPFYPGPGLGGHCIPIDPFYLSWKTRQAGIEARFIELAGHINGQMPQFVVAKIQNALNDAAKAVRGSKVHILGVSYKRDIDDIRESPAIDIMLLLEKLGAEVSYSDPFIPELKLDGRSWSSAVIGPALENSDCVVVITDHHCFDYAEVRDKARLIVDTRNAMKDHPSEKVIRL